MSSELLKILLGLDIVKGNLKKNLFAIFLLGTTIQDSGKRERSINDTTMIIYLFIIYKIKEIESKRKEKSNQEK